MFANVPVEGVSSIQMVIRTGHKLKFPIDIIFLYLKTVKTLTNSADPDKMLPFVTFYHGSTMFTI